MEVRIENGQGIIDILSNGFVQALQVHRPIVADWHAAYGTVGKFYAVSNLDGEITENLVREINQVLIDGNDEEIFSGVKKFLELFVSGIYTVTINRTKFENYVLIYGEQQKNSKDNKITFSYHFHPEYDCVIFSQPYSSIDHSRVAYYVELIRNGLRPKPILVHFDSVKRRPNSSEWASENEHSVFILDGHHKFLAYKQLGINPEFVLIEKYVFYNDEEESWWDKNLYSKIEWLLTDFLKQHIISQTLDYTTLSQRDTDYNKQLDGYLSQGDLIDPNDIFLEPSIMRALKHAFYPHENKNEHLKWLVNRLEVMHAKVMEGMHYRLLFPFGPLSMGEIKCSSLNDFDEWCVKMFGITFDEIKKKSTGI